MAVWGFNTKIKVLGGEIQFAFELPGVLDWQKKIEHFGRRAKNLSPVFAAFWPYFQGSIRRNFQAEGRPIRWPPLADRTIDDRILHGFGPGPILVRTGALKGGFKADWGPKSFRVTNDQDHFWYHQIGGDNLPQRMMVVLHDRDKAEFTRLYRRHLGVDG